MAKITKWDNNASNKTNQITMAKITKWDNNASNKIIQTTRTKITKWDSIKAHNNFSRLRLNKFLSNLNNKLKIQCICLHQ